jgi:hypothetical protein
MRAPQTLDLDLDPSLEHQDFSDRIPLRLLQLVLLLLAPQKVYFFEIRGSQIRLQ